MKKRSKTTRSKRAREIHEVSAGAVVFMIENQTVKVLALVQNNENGEEWFDMPKGHVERGESLVAAAQREIKEEIGLSLHLDTNFQEENSYVIEENRKSGQVRVSKRVVFFLAFMHGIDKKQIVLSEEHKRYYFLPIDEAVKKAKFENQRQLLKDAKAYITEKYLT